MYLCDTGVVIILFIHDLCLQVAQLQKYETICLVFSLVNRTQTRVSCHYYITLLLRRYTILFHLSVRTTWQIAKALSPIPILNDCHRRRYLYILSSPKHTHTHTHTVKQTFIIIPDWNVYRIKSLCQTNK